MPYFPPPAAAAGVALPETLPALVPWRVGRWYTINTALGGTVSAVSSSALFSGDVGTMPLFVPNAVTIDRIGLEVTTLQAGAVIRLGLYAMGADGLPGALLLDAGTVSAAATGLQAIAVSLPLAARTWYALAFHTATLSIGVRILTNATQVLPQGSADGLSYSVQTPRRLSWAIGTLPNPLASDNFSGAGLVALQVRVGSVP